MQSTSTSTKKILPPTPQDRQALENARQSRRPFNFLMLNIQPGTILQFLRDNTITCEVVDDRKVRFRNEVTSLSASANIVIEEVGYDFWHVMQQSLGYPAPWITRR